MQVFLFLMCENIILAELAVFCKEKFAQYTVRESQLGWTSLVAHCSSPGHKGMSVFRVQWQQIHSNSNFLRHHLPLHLQWLVETRERACRRTVD